MSRGPTVVEILVIGNEILNGAILDTNSNWLSGRLYELGVYLRRVNVVRDELKEIASAIRESLRRGTEWIITSGGLGPTFDDLTLQAVAKALRRPLTVNREAIEMLKERYKVLYERGLIESMELTPARLKMATFPKGAKPLKNRIGSAPGVLIKHNSSYIACLPGVPSELKDIYTNELEPILRRRVRRLKRGRVWMLVKGVTESSLSPHIDEVRAEYRDVYIKSHPQGIEDGVSRILLEFLCEGRSERGVAKRLESATERMHRILSGIGVKDVIKSSGRPI